ncbi:MAG: LD-carboxypeptidase [Bacteroidota bacterium]
MIQPDYLKPGDTIAILAPARKVSAEEMQPSISKLKEWGFHVICSEHMFGDFNQYSGTDAERVSDFQKMIDHPEVKAILCGRGGYGIIRIIDKINFTSFQKNPKWICGFSDVTVLHAHINQCMNTETLHCAMPINFPVDGSNNEAILSLKNVLTGEKLSYHFPENKHNKKGNAKGILVGGNLSLLYALQGSCSFPDTENKILFIEDLDEYLYHIDRMMVSLKRAGKLKNLAGLVIGGMTEMKDNTVPFGKTPEEIIMDAVSEYQFPVCFDFPAGHIPDNNAMIMGRNVNLEVCNDLTTLKFD